MDQPIVQSTSFFREMLSQISNNLALQILVLIVMASIYIAFHLLVAILEPMNYELDMTTKKFCKLVAEIDNSLKLRRDEVRTESTIQTNGIERQREGATDDHCTTAADSDSRSTTTHSGSNTNYTQQTGSATGHVYPNGWIPIVESFKVKPGAVKKVIIFGRDLIVTRSKDGTKVDVLDAYCPHMGVHLGVGGQVREVNGQSCIECPFHGWLFSASDGHCVRIPYADPKSTIPPQAKVPKWPCVEVDNFIYVWHHNNPAKTHKYDWELEPADELKATDWQLAGRSCHVTNLELRDMLENGADMNHFEQIHNDLFVFGGNILDLKALFYLQSYVRHHWRPEWKPMTGSEKRHMAEMRLQSWISLFGLRVFDITVRAHQIGPARVNLYYDSKWYGKGLLIMNAIPIGGRRTKYIQHVYTKRSLFHCFMAKQVLWGEIKQLERDFFMWNHKKNIPNPILITEDRMIKKFRRWYSQFLPQPSPRITIKDSDSGGAAKTNGYETATLPSLGF